MSRNALFFAAIALGLLAPAAAQAQEPDPAKVERILKSARSIAKDVEALRGRVFRTDVPKGVQTRSAMKKVVIANMKKELKSQKMQDVAKVIKAFRFVPQDFDFGGGFAEFYGSQIGGYYDPDKKRLFLIAEDKGGSGMPGQSMQDDMVMAHELGHALQDQHFDLSRWFRLFEGEDDKSTAMRAVVEGEATVIGFRWLGKSNPMFKNFSVGRIFEMNKRFAGMDPNARKLSKLPLYIRANAMFPYEKGGIFIEAVLAKKDWAGVDQLFVEPPLSTEQILHPEKYLAEERDQPIAIKMPKLDSLLGDDFRELSQDTVGEWQVRLLLETLKVPEARAIDAAAGWGGDRYQAYEHKKTGRIVLVWLSTWDKQADAIDFFGTYNRALKQTGGEEVLQRRRQRVLLISGATAEEQAKIERVAFESLQYRESFEAMPELLAPPPLSDFDQKAAPAPAPTGSGLLVKEKATRATFRLPGADWKPIDETIGVLRQFSRGRWESADGKAELRYLEFPFEFDQVTIAERLKMLTQQGIQNYKEYSRKNTEVAGRPAFRVDVGGVLRGENGPSRASLVAMEYGDSTLLFIFRADPENWSEAVVRFDETLGSLELKRVAQPKAVANGLRKKARGDVFSVIQPQGYRSISAKGPRIFGFRGPQGLELTATHFASPMAMPIERLARSYEAQLRELYSMKGFEKIRGRIFEITGKPAFEIEFVRTLNSGRTRIRHIGLMLTDSAELHISIAVPEGEYNDDERAITEAIIDSIELINPKAAPPALEKAPSKKRPAGKPKLY